MNGNSDTTTKMRRHRPGRRSETGSRHPCRHRTARVPQRRELKWLLRQQGRAFHGRFLRSGTRRSRGRGCEGRPYQAAAVSDKAMKPGNKGKAPIHPHATVSTPSCVLRVDDGPLVVELGQVFVFLVNQLQKTTVGATVGCIQRGDRGRERNVSQSRDVAPSRHDRKTPPDQIMRNLSFPSIQAPGFKNEKNNIRTSACTRWHR